MSLFEAARLGVECVADLNPKIFYPNYKTVEVNFPHTGEYMTLISSGSPDNEILNVMFTLKEITLERAHIDVYAQTMEIPRSPGVLKAIHVSQRIFLQDGHPARNISFQSQNAAQITDIISNICFQLPKFNRPRLLQKALDTITGLDMEPYTTFKVSDTNFRLVWSHTHESITLKQVEGQQSLTIDCELLPATVQAAQMDTVANTMWIYLDKSVSFTRLWSLEPSAFRFEAYSVYEVEGILMMLNRNLGRSD